MGETKEREDGEKVLSPKSHEPEIKALSWDMENEDLRVCRCPMYSQPMYKGISFPLDSFT